ncbi:MAG TPA: hypothetical protein VNN06_10905 [Ramlibacter sp.]|nr:hypothetical protein [Ramlibacter sp.]
MPPTFDALNFDALPPDSKAPDALPQPDTSLRDALEENFDAGSPSGTPAPTKPGGASDSPSTAPESAPGGRQRGADGKFAKPALSQEDIPRFTDPKKPAPAGDDDAARPPPSWKPEKAGLWDKITDPEARAYVHERERQLQDGFQRAAQVRDVAEGILSEFVPYQEILQQEGATPISAMRTLLQTAYALRTSEPEYRKALFLQLAHQYGVDFTTGINPDLARAQAEAATLRHQAMEQQAYGNFGQEQQVGYEIGQFAEQHEFFPYVRQAMGRLIRAGLAPDLDTAYQQSLKLVPEVAAEVERRNVAAAQERQLASQRYGAARATQGGYSPGAGAMTNSTGRGAMSLRDELEAAWDAQMRA